MQQREADQGTVFLDLNLFKVVLYGFHRCNSLARNKMSLEIKGLHSTVIIIKKAKQQKNTVSVKNE